MEKSELYCEELSIESKLETILGKLFDGVKLAKLVNTVG